MATRSWIGGDSGNEYDANTAANWSDSTAPVSGDDVRVPRRDTMYAITDGLGSLVGGLNSFIVEEGFTEDIGTEDTWLDVDTSRFEWHGSGTGYIDLGTSNIDVEIKDTARVRTAGKRGLYLVGSSMNTVSICAGSVGIASRPGETATATTIRLAAGSVWVGSGVTLTTYEQARGNGVIRCAATTVTAHGGNVWTEETGAITTINAYGGRVTPNSSGTISTLNIRGAVVDFMQSGEARTVTDHKMEAGQLIVDESVVTFTNARTASDFAVNYVFSRAS